MNILLDTNILIPLEDTGRELTPELANVRRLCSLNNIILKTHPAQIDDIERDKDEARKRIVLSRIQQYPKLENPPLFDAMESATLSIVSANKNDEVDNKLLCAIYRNAAHLLVTEDKKIHAKAKHLGIEDRVHYLCQFQSFLEKYAPPATQPPLGIQICHLHELKIENPFFDSLREGYNGFNEWFSKCCRDGRRGWIVKTDDKILALCIWKLETNERVTTDNKILSGHSLKLCTFKVSSEWRGQKMGERILYTAFKKAHEEKLDWVYLTAYGHEQEMLISLCLEFGFEDVGIDIQGRDHVYCKDMRHVEYEETEYLTNLQFAVRHYPCFSKNAQVPKWLVPIQPRYHEMLFPDISSSRDMFPFIRDAPENYGAYANTIKKAYLCHAPVKKIKEGDLLYFYRSDDRKSIECVGIVEKSFRSSDKSEILANVSKRTVYSIADITELAKEETLVILFRHLQYFPGIDQSTLAQKGIKFPIQTIRKLTVTLP
jgi:predicted GNAT family N-acyltransferase/predicted nucleic acid-binding protein